MTEVDTHAETLPPAALDAALQALNAETFARDCVALLRTTRVMWCSVLQNTHDDVAQSVARKAIEAIDKVFRP